MELKNWLRRGMALLSLLSFALLAACFDGYSGSSGNPVNDPPVAVADALSVDQGGTATALTGGATSVLTNDTDAENDPLTAVLVSGPSSGSLALNPDGTFSYTHDGSETVSDSFSYLAKDTSDDSNTVSVSITVNPLTVAVPATANLNSGQASYDARCDACHDTDGTGTIGRPALTNITPYDPATGNGYSF